MTFKYCVVYVCGCRYCLQYDATAVKICVLCVISALELLLMYAYTRKPCCGGETARCRRCKLRYVSKCTAASRGSPCDSTALVLEIL